MSTKEQINLELGVYVNNLKPGRAFNVSYFNTKNYDSGEVTRAFNSLVADGVIQRICKGLFIKHRMPRKLDLQDIISDILLDKNDNPVGYLSYDWYCYKIGVLAEEPLVAHMALPRKHAIVRRWGYTVHTIEQHAPINNKTVPSLQVLDTLKNIEGIEDATPSDIIAGLKRVIGRMSYTQAELMIRLSKNYPSKVRSLLGAILEITHCSQIVCNMFLGITMLSGFEIDIDEEVLPNKKKWNLIPPSEHAIK